MALLYGPTSQVVPQFHAPSNLFADPPFRSLWCGTGRDLAVGYCVQVFPLVDNPLPVVIADDDPDIREMVRTALQLDGFHVLEASNGQTAWELILARRPVVVLADVQMPGIGGLELTARIKAHGYHETKVILFTGGMATEKQAQMAGADAYVTKSAPLSELRAAVRRLCPRTA